MSRLLVVEDEQDLAELLAYNLGQAGHEVTVAHSGAQALSAAQKSTPELVILDLMLPDIPGTEVCRTIRSRSKTESVPVIMLTAKGAENDRIAGFEAGADDYVVKPFSPRELVLRVDAILRRSGVPKPTTEVVVVGALTLDLPKHEARIGETPVDLTPIEFRLLHDLISRRGRVQSRDALLERVWDYQTGVETRTVDTHVKRLREKLGRCSDYIETIRGVGYRAKENVDV